MDKYVEMVVYAMLYILVPIVMIIGGLMMWKYPSKNLYKKIMQNYDITEDQMKK